MTGIDLDGECTHGLGPIRTEFEKLARLETDECIIWPYYNRGPYGFVRDGVRTVGVHVLVLERRVGPRPPGGYEAAHLPIVCHQTLCMNYRHLRWATRVENKADMVLDGTRLQAEAHGRAKLTASDVREIRRLSVAGMRGTQIAHRFGIGRSTVGHIVAGHTWKSVQ